MSTLLCGNTSSVIAFCDYFYVIFTCELAIYYHFPLTEEETETQRMPLIRPRSQLVSGSTASQILVVGNLTTGQSCHYLTFRELTLVYMDT